MSDRYLFKAKRVDNGEWVTGSLITCEDGTCKIATSLLEGKAVLTSRVAIMELWAVTAVMMALWLFQMV